MRDALLILFFSAICSAQLPPMPLDVPDVPQTVSVTLVWNPSSDPNVTGYNIYHGPASRVYTNRVDVGGATNATVDGLDLGATYFFAATAYNLLGMESDYSSEVSYRYVEPPVRPVVVMVSASVLCSASPAGPWVVATNVLFLTVTNPPGQRFWRPGPLHITTTR
jgi:hypothetical protein